jgi:HEPN domain-containing protein
MPNDSDWKEWLNYAEENYLGALELQSTRGLTSILLLHQAVEKYLKAVLVKQEKIIERSHDLVMLVRLILPSLEYDSELWKAARELNFLLPRARYPSRGQQINQKTIDDAFVFAELLRNLAQEKLQED